MAGRPKIQLDHEEVFKLAQLHCTNIEIAAFFGCSVDTLTRNYADELHRGRESAKRDLRDLQWKAAKRLNPQLLIWLGKQYLGQTDKLETKNETHGEGVDAIEKMADSLLETLKISLERK